MIAALVLVIALASPAFAAQVRVNAGDNARRSGDRGPLCMVEIDDYYAHQVHVYCINSGRTWFTVRVDGVDGHPRRISVRQTGDCAGRRVTHRQSGETVLVKIENSGDFNCYYHAVTVRFRGR
jgi:hypothetical protein